MQQKEFETRTGKEVTPASFDYANRVYMAAGEMDTACMPCLLHS